MSTPTTHEVYAVRYAHRQARRADHFVGGDPHDGPMDMDYFVWAIKGDGRIWVVDTGFTATDAAARNRQLLRTAAEGLALIGVDAAAVADVIVTHLHYDHIGGFAQFPRARFHLQDKEMSYATGRHMVQPAINHAFAVDHVIGMVREVYKGRVVFHDGDAELAPGLSLHLVGGHTMGLQVVRVFTRLGWIVLASDASHYYENMESGRPYPIVYDLADMKAAFARLRALADKPAYIVPGHDPLVMQRYTAMSPALEGIAVRLDAEPRAI
ncbi:MAG: N-acyl homoserine lactonase family protein [Alphaproteobacteria bacterium]